MNLLMLQSHALALHAVPLWQSSLLPPCCSLPPRYYQFRQLLISLPKPMQFMSCRKERILGHCQLQCSCVSWLHIIWARSNRDFFNQQVRRLVRLAGCRLIRSCSLFYLP